MAASIDGVFEENLKSSIEAARVLVVGAGGIGCELLKNLVLSGFKDVEIVSYNNVIYLIYSSGESFIFGV
jgi:ubiquitin-like 1-activating enzyme E1 B